MQAVSRSLALLRCLQMSVPSSDLSAVLLKRLLCVVAPGLQQLTSGVRGHRFVGPRCCQAIRGCRWTVRQPLPWQRKRTTVDEYQCKNYQRDTLLVRQTPNHQSKRQPATSTIHHLASTRLARVAVRSEKSWALEPKWPRCRTLPSPPPYHLVAEAIARLRI